MAQLGGCKGQVAVNDAVCVTISLDAADTGAIDIWTNETSYRINGTILVENNGAEGGACSYTYGYRGYYATANCRTRNSWNGYIR